MVANKHEKTGERREIERDNLVFIELES